MVDRLRLAVGDLAADRARTLLTVAALVPLVIAFFIVAAVAEGIRDVAQRSGADLNVVITERSLLDVATGTIDAGVLAAAAEAGGDDVTAVSPMIFRVLLIESADVPDATPGVEAQLLQLRGADVPSWESQHGLELVRGAWPTAVGEVVVTRPVVEVTGWAVGSTVTIFGSDFRIAGVATAPGTKGISVWMPLDEAEVLFSTTGTYQLAYLALADGADGEQVVERLNGDPRIARRHAVVLESRLALIETEAVSAWGGMFGVSVAMALLLIGFGGFNFAALMLQERRHEVGVLRAIGLSGRALRSVTVLRATVVAAASYLLGWAIAWAILRDGLTVDVFGLAVSIGLGTRLVVAGIVLTVAVTWLGARLATRRLLAAPVATLLEH